MKTIIIEDEKPAARRLRRMLEALGVEVDQILHSVEDSKKWFSENEAPDIIFLDIQLSDGLSFEIFEAHDIQSAIIFTTAYDEYALQAFKLNSIDYLLKPIDDEDLKKAVDKYQHLKASFMEQPMQNVQFNFEDIKKLLVNPLDRVYKQRFTAKVGQHIKMINTEDIVCFYSENKGTYVYTTERRNYLLEQTLEQLEAELAPKSFFRVSRKFIVHINALQDIIAYSNSRLKLKLRHYDNEPVIVARERVKDFKAWLG